MTTESMRPRSEGNEGALDGSQGDDEPVRDHHRARRRSRQRVGVQLAFAYRDDGDAVLVVSQHREHGGVRIAMLGAKRPNGGRPVLNWTMVRRDELVTVYEAIGKALRNLRGRR